MPPSDADRLAALERRIYDAIMKFPDRIDHMETRSEESSRRLARMIAALVVEGRAGGDDSQR